MGNFSSRFIFSHFVFILNMQSQNRVALDLPITLSSPNSFKRITNGTKVFFSVFGKISMGGGGGLLAYHFYFVFLCILYPV